MKKNKLFLGMLAAMLTFGLVLTGCPTGGGGGGEADTTAPTLTKAEISANHKSVTLTFSEDIVNATADAAALKVAVQLAKDGTTFAALAPTDTVAISGTTLVVTFETALTTATNKIKVAAEALKDAAGNLTAVITTDTIDASTAAQNQVVDIAAIQGVTAPATGAAPVADIAETAQYIGVVTWAITNGGVPVGPAFAALTAYTATIRLTAKSGYTLTGVAADFFTVAGATAGVTSTAGVITAKFPATGATDDRVELIAGDAVGATATEASKDVTFIFAGTLADDLTADDFTVSGDGGTFRSAAVSGTTVTVTVELTGNTGAEREIVIGIKDTSAKIKAGTPATVTITQAAAGGTGPTAISAAGVTGLVAPVTGVAAAAASTLTPGATTYTV
jgi:hypothetical protein